MKLKQILWRVVFFSSLTAFALARQDKKAGKFLSLFNIVTFPNDGCNEGSKNGTCYLEEECETRGGKNEGSCASGYGVCCSFTAESGSTVTENNTYFEGSPSNAGTYMVKVCKASSDIAQLRLDFDTFVLTGPSTSTSTEEFSLSNGAPIASGGNGHSTASRCLTDIFQVTGSNPNPPAICGTNSGQHMYVDASDDCNKLVFQLGSVGIGTAIQQSRSWNIRISQYSRDFSNLAPAGCTQYFSDTSGSGMLQSYNYGSGNSYHLANQNQVICVRREEGKTKMCLTVSKVEDIDISGKEDVDKFFTKDCCGYEGDANMRDCLRVPSLTNAADGKALAFSRFCGRMGLNTKDNQDGDATIKLCTTKVPFTVTFSSDNYELTESNEELSATNFQAGFKLNYNQE